MTIQAPSRSHVVNEPRILVWAYHCLRCNYVWLHQDIDIDFRGKDIENYWPKSCARCKSRYWDKARSENKGYQFSEAKPTRTRYNALMRRGEKERAIHLVPESEPLEVHTKYLGNYFYDIFSRAQAGESK